MNHNFNELNGINVLVDLLKPIAPRVLSHVKYNNFKNNVVILKPILKTKR